MHMLDRHFPHLAQALCSAEASHLLGNLKASHLCPPLGNSAPPQVVWPQGTKDRWYDVTIGHFPRLIKSVYVCITV